jgi:hypothetical protein
MARIFAIALVLTLSATPTTARDAGDVSVQLRERKLLPGTHLVIVSVYATEEGGEPLATETRTLVVEKSGTFVMPLGALPDVPGGQWLAVRVPPGVESRRTRLTQGRPRHVTVNVVPAAVITANGIVESTVSGFRFPDETVQTTAVISGGATPNGLSSTSGSIGAASTVSRSDHIHPHGNLTGGTLHSNATTSTAGFLSSTDKTKLDGLATYARTIFVTGGGTSFENGTALLNALAGISGNSSSSPYLVKLEAGVFDVSSSQLAMKSYVDIEGSGENSTFITSTRSGASSNSSAAAILGATNSELRSLTASVTFGAGSYSIAYFASGSGGTMRLRDVTLNATGGQTHTYGVYATSTASVSLFHVTVTATQYSNTGTTGFLIGTSTTADVRSSTITAKGSGVAQGVLTGLTSTASSAIVTIDSSTIMATNSANSSYGINVTAGTVTVTGSTVRVDTATVRTAAATSATDLATLKISSSLVLAFSTSLISSFQLSVSKGNTSTLMVATSQVDSASAGVPKCVHVYDTDGDDLNNVCPPPIS